MVSVTIHQDTSAIPPMTSPVMDLVFGGCDQALEERLDKHGSRLYKLENQDILNQVSKVVDEIVTDAIDWAMNAPLRERFKDLPEADMKEILHNRMWESKSYQAHEDHMTLEKKKKRHGSPKTPSGSPPHPPPPPPPPAGPFGTSGASGASGSSQSPPPPPPPSNTQGGQSASTDAPRSSKTTASAEYTAWTMIDTRIQPSILPIPEEFIKGLSLKSYLFTCHPAELTTCKIGDMTTFLDGIAKSRENLRTDSSTRPEDAYKIVQSLSSDVYNVSKPLRWGDVVRGSCHNTIGFLLQQRLGISTTKVLLDSTHISEVIEGCCTDHMRILSVVIIEVFPMYGYNYMKKIVLRRADLKEYVIAERDFKYLYPSDFEDLYLLNLQGHLNHLSPEDKKILTTTVNLWTKNLVIRQRIEDFQLGIESYQMQLNLTKPRWDAKGFEYKHDFTIIDSLRAVTFRDKYRVQMITRFNEIHKFSDGTLHQIDKALDYRVKEFKVNRRNPGLDTRFWTKKDVNRSKEFMFAYTRNDS
ncbi:hypothetical protein Tco_1346356 [Tanacetum coccineum]